jgi:serine/threonine protein kinase
VEGIAQRSRARGSLAAGAEIGRYVLGRRLARGGMAELYLAKALGIAGFEKPCVLKLVLPHLTEDATFVEMFLTEARLAATLDHPNVVHVVDIGEVDGEYFFVMEYVHGRDVRALLRACNPGTMPLQAALTIAHGVAEGLHYVHERRDPSGRFLGLVHRDISPSNVMVSYDGSVKVVDFGIAKATEMRHATRTGVLKGKVHYMAPEQCEGHAIDRRTDVFALGILLYEMTTGRPLFTGTNDYYVMSRIVRGVFARPREVDPAYPPELEQIVLRALARDPKDRYVSAQALQVELEQYARAADLSLSPRLLAETMHEVFGEVPATNFEEDEEEIAPTLLHVGSVDSASIAHSTSPTDILVGPRRPTRVAVPARRRTVALAMALALGVPCLSVGAWAAIELGVGEVPAPAPTAPPVAAAVVEPTTTPAPAPLGPPKIVPISPRAVALPSSARTLAPIPPATEVAPAADPVIDVASPEPARTTESTETKRRRRPARPTGRKDVVEPPRHDPAAMYPSGRGR